MRGLRHDDSHDQPIVAWTCPACGIKANVPADTPRIVCACDFVQEGVTLGLGDLVAVGLHNVGLTRTRYAKVKKAVGLSGCCDCGRRQRRLNELGRRIGIG
jgi:hypothetical protein